MIQDTLTWQSEVRHGGRWCTPVETDGGGHMHSTQLADREGKPVGTAGHEAADLQLSVSPGAPLSHSALRWLYAATDWGVALRDPRTPKAYGAMTGQHSTLAMFRALALPYLVRIESEASLARELAERDALRALCGFESRTPTRAMFWHFRHTPSGFYSEVMLKVLMALGLAAESLDLPLPCVRPVPDDWAAPAGRHFTFRLSPYGPDIEMWTTAAGGSLRRLEAAGKPVGEVYREMKSAEAARREGGMVAQLEFPAEVAVGTAGRRPIRFAIDAPDWLKPGSKSRTRSKDTLTTVGSERTGSYAACNVIVVRQREGAQQVLLSRRLDGSWKGLYVLPGGKAQHDESLEQCTTRELFEETGLRLASSRPISMHLVRLPGRPVVFSVGAVVTEFTGEPRRREKHRNEKWEWFDLNDLPTRLSLPAELALSEYRKGRLQDLEWSDVDIQWRRSQRLTEQLTLDSLLAEAEGETPQ